MTRWKTTMFIAAHACSFAMCVPSEQLSAPILERCVLRNMQSGASNNFRLHAICFRYYKNYLKEHDMSDDLRGAIIADMRNFSHNASVLIQSILSDIVTTLHANAYDLEIKIHLLHRMHPLDSMHKDAMILALPQYYELVTRCIRMRDQYKECKKSCELTQTSAMMQQQPKNKSKDKPMRPKYVSFAKTDKLISFDTCMPTTL